MIVTNTVMKKFLVRIESQCIVEANNPKDACEIVHGSIEESYNNNFGGCADEIACNSVIKSVCPYKDDDENE